MVCRPTLQTTMKVISPDGSLNKGSSVNGELQWNQITPQSKVQYTVKTFPDYDTSRPLDSEEGKSDRVSFQVWRSDSGYLRQKANDAFNAASDEEQNAIVDEIVAVMQGKTTDMPIYTAAIERITDPLRRMSLAHSKTISTDSNGEYVGEYQIPRNAKWGQYAFSFIYGYNNSDEKSEAERLKEIRRDILFAAAVSIVAILTALALVELVVLLMVGSSVSLTASSAIIAKLASLGVSGGIAAAGFTVGFVTADSLFQKWLLETQGGLTSFMNVAGARASVLEVGNNKYGCDFVGNRGTSMSPVIQTYGAIVAPYASLDSEGNMTFTNIQPIPNQDQDETSKTPIRQDPRFLFSIMFLAVGTFIRTRGDSS